MVWARATVAAAPTMTNSEGTTMTLIDRQEFNAASIMCTFEAQANSAAASQTVTFDCTGDDGSAFIIYVWEISDFGSVVQIASTEGGTDTVPAVTMGAAFDTNNCGIGMCGSNVNSTTYFTPPTNWTEDDEEGRSTPATNAEAIHRNSGETGSTITWGFTSANLWVAVVAEIAAAAVTESIHDPFGMSGFFGAF